MFSQRKFVIFLGVISAFVAALLMSATLRGILSDGFERFGYVLVLLAILVAVALLSMLTLKKLGPNVWTVCAVILALCTFGGAVMMMSASGWDAISAFLLLAGVLLPFLGGWLMGGAYLFYRWRKQGVRSGDAVKQSADDDAPEDRDT